jgi:hypothetical protein
VPKSSASDSSDEKTSAKSHSGVQTPDSGLATPLRYAPKTLRPYLLAVMAFNKSREFEGKPSVHRKELIKSVIAKEGQFGAFLTVSLRLLRSKSIF